MSFSSFLFSKRAIAGIAIRFLLYFFTPLTNWMASIPSVSSEFYSYNKLEEAFFFMQNGNDPYQIAHIFHKPLITSLFYQIRHVKILTLIIFIIFDLLIAYFLEQRLFHAKNPEAPAATKDNDVSWSILYLFNPLSVYGCITFSTQSLEYFLALAAIFFAFKANNLIGSIIAGIAIYQNPRRILVLALIFLTSRPDSQGNVRKSSFIKPVVISSAVAAGLVYLSFLITGNWEFVETCYYRSIFVNYLEPNFSLYWHLFTSLFINYSDFYAATLGLFPIFITIPLSLFFKKYLLFKYLHIGYLGLFAGLIFAITVVVSPTATLYDFGIIVLLLSMQIEIIRKIKFILIFAHGLMFGLGMSLYMTYSWKNTMTAEPSWVFLQIGVLYGFAVVVLAEIFSTLRLEMKGINSVEEVQPDSKKIQ